MNYLCLDYGDKNIGVAIATSPIAEPVATYTINNIFTHLSELIAQHSITHIIIGNCPYDFLSKLHDFGLPVTQVDETLTTIDAQKSLFHTTKSRRKGKIHQASAAVILQNWLDSHSQNL